MKDLTEAEAQIAFVAQMNPAPLPALQVNAATSPGKNQQKNLPREDTKYGKYHASPDNVSRQQTTYDGALTRLHCPGK